MTSRFDFELQNYARQGKRRRRGQGIILYPSIVKGETRKQNKTNDRERLQGCGVIIQHKGGAYWITRKKETWILGVL